MAFSGVFNRPLPLSHGPSTMALYFGLTRGFNPSETPFLDHILPRPSSYAAEENNVDIFPDLMINKVCISDKLYPV